MSLFHSDSTQAFSCILLITHSSFLLYSTKWTAVANTVTVQSRSSNSYHTTAVGTGPLAAFPVSYHDTTAHELQNSEHAGRERALHPLAQTHRTDALLCTYRGRHPVAIAQSICGARCAALNHQPLQLHKKHIVGAEGDAIKVHLAGGVDPASSHVHDQASQAATP